MRINIIITLLASLIAFRVFGQEIKTREDAIKFLDKRVNGFLVIENNSRLGGGQEKVTRRLIAYSLENEYLIFKIADEKHHDGRITYFDTKLLLINLTDSVKLLKTIGKENTKAEKYFAYYIAYKNYKICWTERVEVETKFLREGLIYANSICEQLYNAINILKTTFNPNEKSDLKLKTFKGEYLNAGKPSEISEEQRKYIVQANAAIEIKDYRNALLLYRKALEVNKFSYPEAYFNMALILSHLELYYQATFAMKAYLILAPQAEDARKAQDKIYEWEMYIKN